MLKILGRRTSSNVMKVLWACDEMGLKYEQVDIGGSFGGNDKPDYLAKNPNGRVPTIDDDGFILWESNAIVRYLASQHGVGGLWPTDAKVRGDADRWMDWQQTVLAPAFFPCFWNLVRTPEDKRDMGAVQKSKEATAKAWEMVDRALSGRKFIAGDSFTMGDIPIGMMVFRWYTLAPEFKKPANLDSWYKRLQERPAYKTHCMNPLS